MKILRITILSSIFIFCYSCTSNTSEKINCENTNSYLDSLNFFFNKYSVIGDTDTISGKHILDSCLVYTNYLINCHPEKKQFYNIKIKTLLLLENYKELIETIDKYQMLYTEDSNQLLYFYNGICFEQIGNYYESEICFDQAKRLQTKKLEQYPDSADLLIQYVYFTYHFKGIDVARKTYDSIVNIYPFNKRIKYYEYNLNNLYESNSLFFGL